MLFFEVFIGSWKTCNWCKKHTLIIQIFLLKTSILNILPLIMVFNYTKTPCDLWFAIKVRPNLNCSVNSTFLQPS